MTTRLCDTNGVVGLKQVPVSVDASELTIKRSRKLQLPDIDFTECLEKDMSRCDFMPPKNPKTLLLSVNRVPSSVRLPEDCHYRPESLVSLFILPNQMVSPVHLMSSISIYYLDVVT